jgi:predicted dehydrogenase
VVGCGWAGALHADVYHDHPNTELVAICDPDLMRAQTLAAHFGCHAYASLEALLESETIQIASLATPTETHIELGKMLLERGVPVLCEKPLARDSVSARQLASVAEKYNLPLSVNYNRRFAKGYQIAHEHLQSAGRIHFISCILAQNVPIAQTPELRASLPEATLIFDALSHQVDLARFLVGEPQQILALGSREVPKQLFTDIQVSILFESGALGSLVCSLAGPEWGQLPIERTEIAAQEERLIVDNITARVDWFN